jgi:hypothetical protein
VGHQDQDENLDQDVNQDQGEIRSSRQDEGHQGQHDHQEVEVLVDLRQTLVQEEAESDEDQNLDHEEAFLLAAFRLEDAL